MADEQIWCVIVVSQERGTKKNVSQFVRGFPDRASAVKAAESFEKQPGNGANQVAVLESPSGEQLAILPVDFRSTKIEPEWSGFA
jgi:hypothetical protein